MYVYLIRLTCFLFICSSYEYEIKIYIGGLMISEQSVTHKQILRQKFGLGCICSKVFNSENIFALGAMSLLMTFEGGATFAG